MKRYGRMWACLILIAGLILSCGSSSEDDWPQYLGPDRNGISPATGLNFDWPEEGPAVLWQDSLGTGYCGAAIAGGKVYLLDRVDLKFDVLRCYDLQSGEELWHYTNKDSGTFDFNGSRATPTVDDRSVYCVGPMGTVYCIDLQTQRPRWIRNLRNDFSADIPRWAFSQSPLLYKDLVIVAPQGRQAGVVAFDKHSGEVVWKTAQLSGWSGYSSPLLTRISGVEQIVQVTPYEMPAEADDTTQSEDEEPAFDGGGVYGIAPETGAVLWNYKPFNCVIPIPPVTIIGDGRLFITGGYDASQTMIRVSREENDFVVEELFRKDSLRVQLHPALLFQDHLYMIANDNQSHSGLVCMTLSGEICWKTGRKPNFGRGGMILADNHLILVDDKTGDLVAAAPDPAAYTEIGRFKLLQKPQIWAPLALSAARLIVRDQRQVKCIDFGKPAQASVTGF